MSMLPQAFLDRLQDIVPESVYGPVIESFKRPKWVTLRINTIKSPVHEATARLDNLKICYERHPEFPGAVVLDDGDYKKLRETDLIGEGVLYKQNPSSLLAVRILDVKPGDTVLDLCSAPGGKAGCVAAEMKAQGRLVCVESVKKRFFKMKSVLETLGVENAECVCCDGRRYRSKEMFDKALVDAPCSSEGRFSPENKKSYAYWSPRKIKEMSRKQKGLIKRAGDLLRPGGILVYATCTFSPEENEGVIDWFLKKAPSFEVLNIPREGITAMDGLTRWRDKAYNFRVKRCLRVLPTDTMDAFFIAKLQKVSEK